MGPTNTSNYATPTNRDLTRWAPYPASASQGIRSASSSSVAGRCISSSFAHSGLFGGSMQLQAKGTTVCASRMKEHGKTT